MTDFWAGVLAGTLGALIGGFFTAWGARLQVRGMLDAVRLEIEAMTREEHRARQIASQHAALVEMFRTVGKCMHLLEEEAESHRPHNADIGCDGLPSPELHETRTEFESAYWALIHEIEKDGHNKIDASPMDKLMFFLHDACSRDTKAISKYVPNFAKKDPVKSCNYYLAVNLTGTILAFDALEYLRAIRRTLDT
ncbi:hypothetical protein AB0K12_08615 [Nonomuraea sp. NPDC049419]|uniref:hypothetical protein n=1 Tax=Nonomuraea sp. NPDC049419 TaxID=3155772 RepID=UPI00343EE87A